MLVNLASIAGVEWQAKGVDSGIGEINVEKCSQTSCAKV